MKIKKLGNRGFSHDLLLVAVVALFAISGVAYLVASRASTACVNRTYSYGKKGNCVRQAQILINRKVAVNPKIKNSGSFGTPTKRAVTQIQTAYGLPVTGALNLDTWKVICSDSTAPNKGGPFTTAAFTAYKNAGCATLEAASGPVTQPVTSPVSPAKRS